MKQNRKILFKAALCMAAAFLVAATVAAAGKQTIYNSPYVSFSPDGKAWTTNAGDADYTWYEEGTRVSTGIPSSIRALEAGEHYYKVSRRGEIPVRYWEVDFMTASCIHNDYPGEGWHSIDFGTSKCEGYYYSGWFPYCADCGEQIVHTYHYMSEAAAESIDYLEVGTGMDYYYLCPSCHNLEMGAGALVHMCNAISWNKYLVRYHPNAGGNEGGYMEDSIHYYNNATEYEGNPVTSVNHLTKNAYIRIGYEFVEWNTEPDGSGTSYVDGAEIRNLTTENWELGNDKGIVTLYAQWRPSTSTLRIDPAGGAYQGGTEVTSMTQDYGSAYTVDNTAVTAPAGYTVSFCTNGGNSVAPITGTQHFVEWSMRQPFAGRFQRGKYCFMAPDGSTDTITAVYALDSITLPVASKPGSSFGGWYYDEEFEKPAGGPGDTLMPGKNMTLYAQWVDLKLSSKDNYTANGGKGAVDLSWSQSDNNNKNYMIYQSRDGENWTRMNTAEDIGSSLKVEKSFSYTGKTESYTIPYTGFYTLTAEGAQGGSYEGKAGGYGGSTSGRFWLQKGEVITYTIGGQNGYNGGGTATMYGNGGGCTVVSSDKKGTLLIAGGGGGATATGDGGAGGSSANVLSAGISGEAGGAGGGGGYQGGKAGEYILHYHTPLKAGEKQNSCYVDLSGSLIDKYGITTSTKSEPYYDGDDNEHAGYRTTMKIGSSTNLIPVNSSASLELVADYYCYFSNTFWFAIDGTNSIKIYNQNGTLIASQTESEISNWIKSFGFGDYTYCAYRDTEYEGNYIETNYSWIYWDDYGNAYKGKTTNGENLPNLHYYSSCNAAAKGYPEKIRDYGNPWYGTEKTVFRKNISIPEGTTGIYIILDVRTSRHWRDPYVTFRKAQISNMIKVICPYQEGDVVSSKPAGGGSNYVSTEYSRDYTSNAGVKTGNGSFSIVSEKIGYLDTLELKNVMAPDKASPDGISLSTVVKEPVGNDRVKVTWTAPKDKGTDYCHVAESYLSESDSVLCRSNVTKNTLISGIKGYYYRVDEYNSGNVGTENGIFLADIGRKGIATIILSETVQYLHVAPVDVAGNVGTTTHIRIGSLAGAEDVLWKLYTEQLIMEETENVYPAVQEKTWYVRGDGKTPFTLYYSAYMDGPATMDFQLNQMIFESRREGILSKNIFTIPSSEINNGETTVPMGQVIYIAENEPLLSRGFYEKIIRKNRNRQLHLLQQFIPAKETAGKTIFITPVAGADYKGETVFSNEAEDRQHSLTIIGDSEPPVINGLEMFHNREMIDRRDGTVTLQVTASDDLSGVKEFYLKIYNTDNAVWKEYRPEPDGSIRVVITEDEPIFSGDFNVTAYAVDHVGNEREEIFSTTEFSLATEVKRVLEPHNPIFKCGESGILTITTWGYADRVEVEFPAEITAMEPGLDTVYSYILTPRYRQDEQLQFMIPLYTPQNASYTITVRAYKGDKQLEDYPDLSVIDVNGSVLDEIRTRLR